MQSLAVMPTRKLGNCDLDNVLTAEQFSKGLWLCRAPAHYYTINIIYMGRVIASLKESHTEREARALAQLYIDQNRL